MFKHLTAALVVVVLSCFTGTAYASSKPCPTDSATAVPYSCGKTFHLEFRVVRGTEAAKKLLGEQPSGYKLSKVARGREDSEVSFLSCDVLLESVEVTGFKGDPGMLRMNFELAPLGGTTATAIVPTKVGRNSVRFENVKITSGATSLILPFAFEGNTTVTVTVKGWKSVSAIARDGVHVFRIGDRTTTETKLGRPYVGAIIPMPAAPGTCSS